MAIDLAAGRLSINRMLVQSHDYASGDTGLSWDPQNRPRPPRDLARSGHTRSAPRSPKGTARGAAEGWRRPRRQRPRRLHRQRRTAAAQDRLEPVPQGRDPARHAEAVRARTPTHLDSRWHFQRESTPRSSRSGSATPPSPSRSTSTATWAPRWTPRPPTPWPRSSASGA